MIVVVRDSEAMPNCAGSRPVVPGAAVLAVRRSRSFPFAREVFRPPPWMNSTMRLNSSRSNQVPCCLQISTITPEQRAKFIRFINCEHSGHGTYFTLLVSGPVPGARAKRRRAQPTVVRDRRRSFQTKARRAKGPGIVHTRAPWSAPIVTSDHLNSDSEDTCASSRSLTRVRGRRATALTVFAANEHHRETRGTGNRRQTRIAKLARRRVGRTRGATVWAVESFRLHRFRILTCSSKSKV